MVDNILLLHMSRDMCFPSLHFTCKTRKGTEYKISYADTCVSHIPPANMTFRIEL